MSSLLWFAVWAAAIFLMMRFGCGAHVMGHSQHGKQADGGEEPRWVPPDADTDPVCGKTVKTANAKPSVFDGHVYYFCSRECREVFEAAPEQYAKGNTDASIKHLGDSHA
mgnify:CR=1 FL=1